MPTIQHHHTEEINEIITAVPSWILKWGITIVFLVLTLILALSSIIRYPDVVKAQLKVNSLNSPKGIIAHQSGKLTKLLIADNQTVKAKQPMAYIESTANHDEVLALADQLKRMSEKVNSQQPIMGNEMQIDLNLGELQGSYQVFYQEYLQFINTQNGGFYLTQLEYLKRDLAEIKKLHHQIIQQKQIQEQEFANTEEEYEAYKKLRSKNVISNNEFKQQENKFLSSKYPLQQTATALLNNNSAYLAKQKELVTLENSIKEQKAKFAQALNSMINETNTWLMKYVVSSPIAGKAGYAGILQENQNVNVNQELFIVNPGNTNYFGEISIPQHNMGKIMTGQRTLIKLRSYPFEEYGMLNGKISHITDVALKDSVFIAKVDFVKIEQKNPAQPIVLKPGMLADAEIVTRESSLLQRLVRNITKMLNSER